jgi:hypothetical protein
MFLAGFWPVYQFLWTVYFLTMFLVGFWCIFMFFGVVIPMWLTEGLAEYFGKTKKFNPEDIRRRTLAEQEGGDVLAAFYRRDSNSEVKYARPIKEWKEKFIELDLIILGYEDLNIELEYSE